MLPKSEAFLVFLERKDSTEIVDVAGIDTRIPAGRRRVHLTEGGLELYVIQIEKSAEVIVVEGKRADKDNRRTHELMKD